MPINSKKKGARAEREIADIIRQHGYEGARRGQQYNGLDGEDVVGLPGFHIESKYVEKLNLYDAIDQSKRDAKTDQIWLVVHRKNRTDWNVTLDFETFLELIKKSSDS